MIANGRRGRAARGQRRRTGAALVAVAVAVAAAIAVSACGGAPILANPPQVFASPAARPSSAPRPPDPLPLAFPRDDGPHDRLTEWWYYTGHLQTSTGRRFGFEAVVFRAERSDVPTAWAAHLALTDEDGEAFHYAQRSEIGPQVDRSPRAAGAAPSGFDLQVAGLSPILVAGGAPAVAAPWRLAGGGGDDVIEARLTAEESSAAGADMGLQLRLRDADPPTPHDGDGFVDFGPAGTSYYYSRMRMDATGTLLLNGDRLQVTGTAWFDHQWGDFVSVGGGWDWFAINLDDEAGTDITLSVVRDPAGVPVLHYGTLVSAASVEAIRLDGSAFAVETLGTWTSPRTGRTWPSGWRATIGDLVITLDPSVDDQELDTRATTGVVYWEGSQTVSATRDGLPVGGEAYVEITRYAEQE